MKPQKILIISPMPTHPPDAGNRRRILNMAELMRSWGHDVYFVHVRQWRGDDDAMRDYWGDRLISLPYRCPSESVDGRRGLFAYLKELLGRGHSDVLKIDDWYDDSIEGPIRELHTRCCFDTVIVEYVFWSSILNSFDGSVTKVIDTHDVFWGRHEMLVKQGGKPAFFSTTTAEEAKGIDRADIVIAIQERDAACFRSLTKKKVVTVGHLLSVAEVAAPTRANTMIFLGSRNPANVDAVKYFVRKVFPIIKNHVEDCEFVVAGGVCERLSNSRAYTKTGFVEDVASVYEKATVVVSPVLYGTGLKIKTIEALGYGKIVVTTTRGVEGIEECVGNGVIVADEPEVFAKQVVRVMTDRVFFDKMTTRALAFAETYNKKNAAELAGILSSSQHV